MTPGLDRTAYGLIRDIVARETRYMRHYDAQVVDNKDSAGKGRVRVIVPALGRFNADEGMTAWPRYINHALSVPKRDEWVELYFMNADPNRPVYLVGQAGIKETQLDSYDGPQTHVLFEHPDGKYRVVYDDQEDRVVVQKFGEMDVLEGWITIKDEEITIGGGSEAFTLGSTLKSYLSSLKTYIDAHVHSGVTTGDKTSGSPASPSPSVPNIESSKIKGE